MEALDTKLLLKMSIRGSDGAISNTWVHFCYVQKDIYDQFLSTSKSSEDQLNNILSRWCFEEFGVKLLMDKPEDLATLKELIKDRYKSMYPEFYRDSSTDRQGWTRIWVNHKMREEIEKNGESGN